MKKVFLMLAGAVLSFGVMASEEVFQVKVAETAANRSYSLAKKVKEKAQKAALTKYMQKLSSDIPDKMKQELLNEYSLFIVFCDKLSEEWSNLGGNSGQLAGEYKITVDAGKVNSWLKEKGFSHSASIQLVIMEEPPTLGQMKIDKAFGNGVDGNRFFMQNYTTFQRRLRDAIIKKMDGFGFDIKLLEDDDLYKKYKDKDSNLVGVYFDVNNNNFAVSRDLLEAVKENNPDTLVLYYRIDALIYNKETEKVRSTIGFTLKNLSSGVTKVFGTPQTYEIKVSSTAPETVIDDLSFCVQSAMNLLINGEDAAAQLNKIAITLRNQAKQPAGPLKLIVNAVAFDKKIRKKAMYMLKKELIAKKLSSADKIRSTNTTLTATITTPGIQETDVLYMEHISPILEGIGVELDDDKVNYSGTTLTIKP